MSEKEDLNEQMLNAWLHLSTAVSNERIVKNMTFNEALICNILSRTPKEIHLTATDLCEKTKMHKSQMNRTLHSMEMKGWIVRERSLTDQRQIYIKLNQKNLSVFAEEHQKNLNLVGEILDRYGRDRADALVADFSEIAQIAEAVLS